jgi:tRNA 2-thiouridine synthesizing protein A
VTTPHSPAGTSAAGRPGPTTAAMHPAPTQAPALTIDALGRKCPIPIIMLAERIGEVLVGQIVAVLADDPAAQTDIPAWCMLKSQEYLGVTELPRGWSFQVRRSY